MRTVSLSAFGHLVTAKEIVDSKALDGELPSLQQVQTLAKWTGEMLELFNTSHDQALAIDTSGHKLFDRSGALMRMAYFGAEQGWDDQQIMVVLQELDTRWEKYVTRRDREHRYLVPMINRARQKHGYAGSLTDLALGALMMQQTKPIKGDADQLVFGFTEFVNTEFKINWLLENLFAERGFGLLVAHPGVGKTTLAIQMGAHLALGMDAFLKWPNRGGSKKVLFLSLEMGKPPLNHFLSQILGSYEDVHELDRNFRVAPLGTPLPLDTQEGQAFLNNLMDVEKPDVLIIDSLQKVSSKELTDEQAVKNLIHYLSALRAKYETSLLVIHHNRKKPNDAQKKNVELSDVYGSTYITTDADFVMNLHTESRHVVKVTMVKNRLGEVPDPFDIYRDKHLTFSMDFENIEAQFAEHPKDSIFNVA